MLSQGSRYFPDPPDPVTFVAISQHEHVMTKLLVLYYSTYGHIETMAGAVAEGARSVEGVEVTLKRVPETMPEEIALKYGAKLDQAAPIAEPGELPEYDAIIFGTPTRFGNMAAQMRNFLDQTGQLWLKGSLVGKVSSVFASTVTGGGNESTILTFIPTLLHHGMIYVGPALLGSGAHRYQRGPRRQPLRRGDHCRTGRLAPTEREGTLLGTLPREACRGDRRADEKVKDCPS